MKKILLLVIAVSISACAKKEMEWTRNVEGNQMTITSNRWSKSRELIINVNQNTWTGAYVGDKEMVEPRKELLKQTALEEIGKSCMGKKYETISEPNYNMMDSNGMMYGGGLLGYALASAMSEYKNLPTGLTWSYRCENDAR